MQTDITPLRNFVIAMTKLVEQNMDEAEIMAKGKKLLADLISTDSWLPEFCSAANTDHYQQYLLHADPLERFSIVSFVWGPGQATTIHDHTTWGLIGMLRGSEQSISYQRNAEGKLEVSGDPIIMKPGEVAMVSPTIGDIHKVSNAEKDTASISIHVYGSNIGATRRHVFSLENNEVTEFVSGYSSTVVPNLWDRSGEIRPTLN